MDGFEQICENMNKTLSLKLDFSVFDCIDALWKKKYIYPLLCIESAPVCINMLMAVGSAPLHAC